MDEACHFWKISTTVDICKLLTITDACYESIDIEIKNMFILREASNSCGKFILIGYNN